MASLFLLAVTSAATLRQIPPLAVAAYFLFSPMTFFAYGLDKQSAREGRWRIRENTLHGLSLLGGWPGALVAQGWLRHKTRKTSFRTTFWMTVVLNLFALALTNDPLRQQLIVGRFS